MTHHPTGDPEVAEIPGQLTIDDLAAGHHDEDDEFDPTPYDNPDPADDPADDEEDEPS